MVGILMLLSASACGGGDTSRYEQTWEKPYEETTCVDWMTEMTEEQQFAMSADLLTALRLDEDPDAEFASDELFAEMLGGIQGLCDADLGYPDGEKRIAAMALLVYSDNRARLGP